MDQATILRDLCSTYSAENKLIHALLEEIGEVLTDPSIDSIEAVEKIRLVLSRGVAKVKETTDTSISMNQYYNNHTCESWDDSRIFRCVSVYTH